MGGINTVRVTSRFQTHRSVGMFDHTNRTAQRNKRKVTGKVVNVDQAETNTLGSGSEPQPVITVTFDSRSRGRHPSTSLNAPQDQTQPSFLNTFDMDNLYDQTDMALGYTDDPDCNNLEDFTDDYAFHAIEIVSSVWAIQA